MTLKQAWTKATAPIKNAATKVKNHLVYITTRADDDVQRREICGFLGVAALTGAFFMCSGDLDRKPVTPSVSAGQVQSQQIPVKKDGERVTEEVMGGILGLAGAAHIGLAAKSHMNLRKKGQKPA